MKASGYFISPAAEFTAGMEDGKYHFHCRNPFLTVDSHRNTAAVIPHCDGIIRIDKYFHGITETGQCLIHGIVYDLIHQMMESLGGSTADIHTWSFSNCFQAFQDLNLIRAVFLRCRTVYFTHKINTSIVRFHLKSSKNLFYATFS